MWVAVMSLLSLFHAGHHSGEQRDEGLLLESLHPVWDRMHCDP